MENTKVPGAEGVWRSQPLPEEDRIVTCRQHTWHEGARISGGMALAVMSETLGKPRTARSESVDWPV